MGRMSVRGALVSFGALLGVSLCCGAPAFAAGPVVGAPKVDSEAVSSLTPIDAVLEARVTSENEATEYEFEYSEKATGETLEDPTVLGLGTLAGSAEEQTAGPVDVGGLTPETTYYYRVVVTNASGTQDGIVQSFTTLSREPPSIARQFNTVGPGDAVTLVGVIVPLFQPVTLCEFQFANEEAELLMGTVRHAMCVPSASELGDGDLRERVEASFDLDPNESVFYRLVAANGSGVSYGPVEQLFALPLPPTVKTGGVSAVTANSATISGEVNPGSEGPNSDTTYWFQYSPNGIYKRQVPNFPADAGQGETTVKESVALSSGDELSGLEPGTTYYYRIVASNDNANTSGGAPQVVYGEAKSFTTPVAPPVLGPVAASAITESSVTVTGSLDAQGLPTRYELRLGTEPGDLLFAAAGDTSATGSQALALTAGELIPGTLYYYQLVALNPNSPTGAGGEREPAVSAVGSFTTLAAPVQAQEGSLFAPVALLSVPPGAFASEASFIDTSTPKKLTNAQKLTAALKMCARKAKGKRAACEKQARKRYGAKAKTKNSGKRG
jgi:hypothetical protein